MEEIFVLQIFRLFSFWIFGKEKIADSFFYFHSWSSHQKYVLQADQGVCLFPLCRCHAVKGTVLLALYGRQSFIWVLSHVFPPFFLCRSPRKGFLPRRRKLRIVRFTASGKTHSLRCSSSPHKAMRLCGDPDNGGVFRRWHAPRTSGHFVPKWLDAVLPLPGYSFSDGHSVFNVLFIDELTQVYTFLTACAVYPKGGKSV